MSLETKRLFDDGKTYIILPDRRIWMFESHISGINMHVYPRLNEQSSLYGDPNMFELLQPDGYEVYLVANPRSVIVCDSIERYSKNRDRIKKSLESHK